MRAAAGIVLIGVCCALWGCGTSDRDQIRATIGRFAQAAAGHDYRTICDNVLAPSLVSRLSSAGVSCEQAMAIAFGQVQEPALSIGRIDVSGASASAITLSTARNQQASLDAIKLTKTKAGWRIASLASPLAGSGSG